MSQNSVLALSDVLQKSSAIATHHPEIPDSVEMHTDLVDYVRSELDSSDLQNEVIMLALACQSETDADLAELAAFSSAIQTNSAARARGFAWAQDFSVATREAWGIDLPDMSYPVAVGYVARLMAMPSEDAIFVYIKNYVEQQARAAGRKAQSQDLQPEFSAQFDAKIAQLAARASKATLADLVIG